MTTTPKQMTLEQASAELRQEAKEQEAYSQGDGDWFRRIADAIDAVASRDSLYREKWIEAMERALPFIDDEASKYEDDSSNEPLDVADMIRGLLDAARQENKP